MNRRILKQRSLLVSDFWNFAPGTSLAKCTQPARFEA
jgi:hypothetical protein